MLEGLEKQYEKQIYNYNFSAGVLLLQAGTANLFMELLKDLFEGSPNLWGGGVAHSVLILSLVIAFGIMLGKVKIAGISLGVTWILFVGIVFGHFNLSLNEHLLHFLKEFGLILFVYSIGLQVGPGFFSAFKKGGFTLNILAVTSVSLSVAVAIVLYLVTDTPITTIVGILSGAVTNTPGLGAAQQANSDLNGIDAPEIAMGYAVAYPLGVIGAILALQSLKYILKINTTTEEAEAEKGMGHLQELTVRPVSLEIINKAIDNKTIKDIHPLVNRKFVISRIRDQHGKQELVNSDTELHLGDQILVISNPKDIEAITVFFGKQIDVKWEDDIDRPKAGNSDRVYVGYFYDTQPRAPQMVSCLGACRRDGRVIVDVPSAGQPDGTRLHLYLFFGNKMSSRFSPSEYVEA